MIQSIQQYIEAVKTIKLQVDRQCDKLQEQPEVLRDFLSSTVNLHKFFPNQNHDDLTFAKKVMMHEKLKTIERYIDLDTMYSMIEIEGDVDFLNYVGKRPYIFASFHYGTLGPIIAWIMREGFHLSMLSATNQGLKGEMLHDSAPENIEVLDASSVDVMIKLVHNMRSNKCVFGLMDGIWGVTKDEEKKSFSNVELMNHTFSFKKGLSMLSYAAGAHIIPVIALRDSESGKFIIRFEKPIEVSQQLEKNKFIENSLQKCFDIFQTYLNKYPEQWDFWNVCHQFLAETIVPKQVVTRPTIKQRIFQYLNLGSYKFNREQYDICIGGYKNYIIKKQNQSCFAVSKNLSQFLKQLPIEGQKTIIVKKQINEKILDDLIKNKVLVPSYA
jgi:lauroyl/myristoyl acyltransferase